MFECAGIAADAIAALEVWVVRLPVRTRRAHGIGDIGGEVENVILRLTTEGGLIGWGEASPWPAFTGTAGAAVAALDVQLRPLLLGADPRRVSAIMANADAMLVGQPEAKAALEMALFDLLGKQARLPVAELLGGRCRDRLALSVSLANPDFEADLVYAQDLVDRGVGIFKVKTGVAGHAFDMHRLETLRMRFGASIDLRIDYNQGLQPEVALRCLRDIEQFAPTFIEQPVPAHCWQAMARITANIDTPILADESVFDACDARRAIEAGICDAISVKVMKSGGMRACQRVSAVAQSAGLPCYGGDMFETGLAHLAGVHLVAATPNVRLGCEYYQASFYLQEDLLAEPFPVDNGEIVVPTTPGLGMAVDEDKLARMGQRVSSRR